MGKIRRVKLCDILTDLGLMWYKVYTMLLNDGYSNVDTYTQKKIYTDPDGNNNLYIGVTGKRRWTPWIISAL